MLIFAQEFAILGKCSYADVFGTSNHPFNMPFFSPPMKEALQILSQAFSEIKT